MEQDVVSVVTDWIKESSKIIILTGYDLSLESCLPDFSDSRLNPNIRDFRENPEVRQAYWEKLRDLYPILASTEPNDGHKSIAELEMICKVDCIFTQCTDGLHQKAGSQSIIELFGSILWVTCTSCGKDYKMEQVLGMLGQGIKIPACEACGKDVIKPRISFPGQPLPHWELREAWMRLHDCELFLIVGAVLDNSPLASLQTLASENGSKIAIINDRESEADNYADAVIYGKPGMIISHIVKKIKEEIIIS